MNNIERAVIYSQEQRKLLIEKRNRALDLMEAIEHLDPQIYGSVARGDIYRHSDIDVVILYPISEFELISCFSETKILKKRIVQATPWLTPKGIIYFDPEISITYPLRKFRPEEIEFYKFGGMLSIDKLKENTRVKGVNKRLNLIKPTSDGYMEISINLIGANLVAKELGVSPRIINERIYVLTRRDKIGRTGLYIDLELTKDGSIDYSFNNLKSARFLRQNKKRSGE